MVYDILGRELASLINKSFQPGTYEVKWDGYNFTSGVYFYRIQAADFVAVKKMVLVK